MEQFELLVVGGGAAGMAAALAGVAAGMTSILLVEREDNLGGILNQCLHRGFGLARFGAELTGPEYALRFSRRLASSPVRLCLGTEVLRLDKDKSALLSSPAGLRRVTFSQCVLAAGCREKTIGSLPVHGTRPAGVFTAGAAQRLVNLGGYHIGSRIVILGSGDLGQIMARHFALLGRRVLALVEQKDRLGGLPRNRRDCVEAFHIPVVLRATVEEVRGCGRISGVVLRHLDSGLREFLPCDTLVTALGLIPARELAAPLMEEGHPPDWLRLCGNCDRIHDMVDSVTAQGEALFLP